MKLYNNKNRNCSCVTYKYFKLYKSDLKIY